MRRWLFMVLALSLLAAGCDRAPFQWDRCGPIPGGPPCPGPTTPVVR